MTGDPYEEADEQQRLDAKLVTPNAARKSRRVVFVGLAMVGVFVALLIFAGIAGMVKRSGSGKNANGFWTMDQGQADIFANQQKYAAGLLNKPAQPQGDPYDESEGVPPKTKAQDDAEHGRGGPPQKSDAELRRERLALEMEHRRKNDLDSSIDAIDFSDYFEREQQQKEKEQKPDADAATTSAVETASASSRSMTATSRHSSLRDALQDDGGGEEEDAAQASRKQPHDPKEDWTFDSSWGKLYRLMEDTVIETVLVNRLTGAAAGPVITMVATDVYSQSGQHVLIPKGTRMLGSVTAVANRDQQRLFVAFHRMIMPDGYSVSLDKFKGLDVVGQTGLRDLVNHHYFQIFGASLAIAGVGAVAQIGNSVGYATYDWGAAMRGGISNGLSEAAERVMQRYLNVLPTFTIRERARVTIMLSGDLLLPDTKNHTMDPDL